MSDHKKNLRPFGAHMQGLGMGLTLGMVTAFAAEDGVALYTVSALSIVLVTAGYIVDKRSRGVEYDE